MQINWVNLWTGGSAVLLVGADAALIAESAAWAVSGLAHLAPAVSMGLYVLAGIVALWATAGFARKVHEIEPFFGPLPQPAEAPFAGPNNGWAG